MEELDLLKKNWNSSQQNEVQVSENQIYAMLQRGSSSVVRWILIIGILEFLVWITFSVCSYDDKAFDKIGLANYKHFIDFITIFNYVGIVVFIILFYKNFQAVSTTTNTRKLMHSILKVRKTVNFYVTFNLFMCGFGTIIIFVLSFLNMPELEQFRNILSDGNHKMKVFLIVLVLILVIAALLFFIWLFYKLLYGILLKKLYRNYEELKKIDL